MVIYNITFAKLVELCWSTLHHGKEIAIKSSLSGGKAWIYFKNSTLYGNPAPNVQHAINNPPTAHSVKAGYKAVDWGLGVNTFSVTDHIGYVRKSSKDISNLPKEFPPPYSSVTTTAISGNRYFIVPNSYSDAVYNAYFTAFLKYGSGQGAKPTPLVSRTPDVRPIYLNDLGRHRTPIYYPKRDRRKRL